MRTVMRFLLALVVVLALAPESAWAQRRGYHHHHRTVIVGSAFYFGSPMWYGYHYPPPYYYGPLYEATEALPAMYIEKFEGQPDANSGDIFCPASGAYYPDAQECANGWQRIIHPPATAAQGG